MLIVYLNEITNLSVRPEEQATLPKQEEIDMSSQEHNYIESDDEREAGHEDTRHFNLECETFDSIGCDTGVDVAG